MDNMNMGTVSNIPRILVNIFAVLITVLVAVILLDKVLDLIDRPSAANERTINITAEGKITATPDIATVNASVVTEGSTAQTAQSENTTKMNRVIDFVKAQGVKAEDIKTQDYSVYPKYDYTDGRSILSGYTASQTLYIKLRDLSAVGKLLDGLTQNGVNQIQNVSYSFDNPDDFRQEAREQALANAKEKAQRLADAAGVDLGKLVSFSESSSYGSVPPMPYYDAIKSEGAMGMGGAAPMVEPGVQEITAQVNVVFQLK